jgi:YHS domain-containing protein
MKTKHLFWLFALVIVLLPIQALAGTTAYSTVGAGGYDLVSYHTGQKPLRGNGNHVSVQDGVTYLFISKQNKARFESGPDRYLPAYGGYCAYGVALGKKFVGDPDVWALIDSRLYLNLDNRIQGLWNKDIPGYIKKAGVKWPRIEDKMPSAL